MSDEAQTIWWVSMTPDGRIKAEGCDKFSDTRPYPQIGVRPPRPDYPQEARVMASSLESSDEAIERGRQYCERNESAIRALGVAESEDIE